MRLQSALEARVAAEAAGALARIEVPRLGLTWDGAAVSPSPGRRRRLRADMEGQHEDAGFSPDRTPRDRGNRP